MVSIVLATDRRLISLPIGCMICTSALHSDGIPSHRAVDMQASWPCSGQAGTQSGMMPQTIDQSQMPRIHFPSILTSSSARALPHSSRRLSIVLATSDPAQTDRPVDETGRTDMPSGTGTVPKDGVRKRSNGERRLGFGATVPSRGRKGAAGGGEEARQPGSSGNRRREQTGKTGSMRRPTPETPLIGADAGDSNAVATEVETAAVIGLGALFGFILLEGLFLAFSGFLPEEWDAFAVEKIPRPGRMEFFSVQSSQGLTSRVQALLRTSIVVICRDVFSDISVRGSEKDSN